MPRPRKTVDEKRVIELASKGLTVNEIAAHENVSHDTITRNYALSLERGRQLCNASLRKKQFEVAMKGNPVMLIWLGKNALQQTDKQEIDVRKQTSVQMVIGIEPAKIKALIEGYSQPQLPSEAESITVEPENQQNGAESMPDEASELKQKG